MDHEAAGRLFRSVGILPRTPAKQREPGRSGRAPARMGHGGAPSTAASPSRHPPARATLRGCGSGAAAASGCHRNTADRFGGFGSGWERFGGSREKTFWCFSPIPERKHQSYGVANGLFLVTVLSTIDLKISLQFVCIDQINICLFCQNENNPFSP